MDATPPITQTVSQVGITARAEWERRLLEKARLLHEAGKSGMLMVKFDGQTVTFWRVLPDGRVE